MCKLHAIRVEKNFNNHTRVCCENTPLPTEIPSPETKLKFCYWKKTQRCTFTVYADLEALLVPEQKNIGRSTIVIESQFPASYGAVLVDSQSKSVVKESFYGGENSINKLVDCFRRWLKFCDGETLKNHDLKKVMGTKEREQLLRSSSKKCCLCNSEIEKDAVIHHSYATGEVYGLAHSNCNLKARTVKFLPVFLHNLARYDAHQILKYLQLRPNEMLSAIARTGEIFISLSIKIQTSE